MDNKMQSYGRGHRIIVISTAQPHGKEEKETIFRLRRRSRDTIVSLIYDQIKALVSGLLNV